MKIAFCQLCVTICGRFDPNEGDVVGYVDRLDIHNKGRVIPIAFL